MLFIKLIFVFKFNIISIFYIFILIIVYLYLIIRNLFQQRLKFSISIKIVKGLLKLKSNLLFNIKFFFV